MVALQVLFDEAVEKINNEINEGKMINEKFYLNVARLMGIDYPRPKPRLKCDILDQDRAETLDELKVYGGYRIC